MLLLAQVSLYLLGERADLLDLLLRTLRYLQWMHPYTRKAGEHVRLEHSSWVHAINLEQQLLALVEQMLSRFMSAGGDEGEEGGAGGSSGAPSEDELQALVRATQQVVEFTAAWATEDLAREPSWSLTSSPVSAHIPLHRTAAAFVAALAHCQRGRPEGPCLLEEVCAEGVGGGRREQLALLCEHPARVLAWMSQVEPSPHNSSQFHPAPLVLVGNKK
jgi:hypothetical protein